MPLKTSIFRRGDVHIHAYNICLCNRPCTEVANANRHVVTSQRHFHGYDRYQGRDNIYRRMLALPDLLCVGGVRTQRLCHCSLDLQQDRSAVQESQAMLICQPCVQRNRTREDGNRISRHDITSCRYGVRSGHGGAGDTGSGSARGVLWHARHPPPFSPPLAPAPNLPRCAPSSTELPYRLERLAV